MGRESRIEWTDHTWSPWWGLLDMYLRWTAEGVEKGWKPSAAWARYYAMFKEPPKAEWMLEADARMRPIIAAAKAGGAIRAWTD